MSKVYFCTGTDKIPGALDQLDIEKFRDMKVLVKLHMGEPGNQCFISPSLVKLIVGKLKEVNAKPFLFDTTVAYSGLRGSRDGYLKVAHRHGFGNDAIGCEVIIGDAGVQVEERGHILDVAREIYETSHLVVISHVKGHIQTGFGGAIKNLGMGGVTKHTKRLLHRMSIPRHLAEKCDLCDSCAEICPRDAITVEVEWKYDSAACDGCGKCVDACPNEALNYEIMDLQEGLATAARACIAGKTTLYINALVDIAQNCDCDPHAGPIICPDIGYLASKELAAIDRASLELVHKIKPGIFEEVTRVDPSKQIKYAQDIGLDSSYELIRL